MTTNNTGSAARVRVIALAACLAAMPVVSLHAQGLESQEAIDTIIGSEVTEQERTAGNNQSRIIGAIEKTAANTAEVRKKTSLDKVEIIFLSDATGDGAPADVGAKLDEFSDEIQSLRQELEGNAMLYHAINSRDVMMRDIIAIEFDDENNVVIFAAASPAAQ